MLGKLKEKNRIKQRWADGKASEDDRLGERKKQRRRQGLWENFCGGMAREQAQEGLQKTVNKPQIPKS